MKNPTPALLIPLATLLSRKERSKKYEVELTARGSCHDERALSESSSAAQVCNNLAYRPDHVVGRGFLPRFSIDTSYIRQSLGIWDRIRRGDCRPNGRESIEGFSVAELATTHPRQLEVPGADIVANGVSKHVVESPLL